MEIVAGVGISVSIGIRRAGETLVVVFGVPISATIRGTASCVRTPHARHTKRMWTFDARCRRLMPITR